jgi:cruciform cutting endonuclease 1
MARRYREKWDRSPGGRRKGEVDGEEKMGKLDDLADCLMQGMAWIEWEENKRKALEHGVEALLGSEAMVKQSPLTKIPVRRSRSIKTPIRQR